LSKGWYVHFTRSPWACRRAGTCTSPVRPEPVEGLVRAPHPFAL